MKKRTLALFCAVVMLVIAAVPLTALANMQYRYVYTSNGKSLNLRSAPVSHSDNKIANIPYGTRVAVDSYVNNSSWAYVEYNGTWGYVMSRYLVKNEPGPRPTTTSSNGGGSSTNTSHNGEFNGFVSTSYNAVVRASSPGGFVNLRWAPSKSDAIQARLVDGESLVVISQNSSWAQVRVASTGAVGFMMRSFITEITDGVSDS